jgi:stage V sporulation protein B
LEVLFKVLVGLALAWYLLRSGKSLPIASAGAVFGVTVGGLAALIYMIWYKKRYYKNGPVSNADIPDRRGKIFQNLLRIGIPITLGSSVLSLINLVDAKLVLNRLQYAAGFPILPIPYFTACMVKSRHSITLPPAFITASDHQPGAGHRACMARHERMEAARIAENSLRISAVVALPMGVGHSVLAYPIMNVVYSDSHVAGPELLSYMGIASFFVCMAIVMTAILQAHGNELYPVYSMIAGGVVKVVVKLVFGREPRHQHLRRTDRDHQLLWSHVYHEYAVSLQNASQKKPDSPAFYFAHCCVPGRWVPGRGLSMAWPPRFSPAGMIWGVS